MFGDFYTNSDGFKNVQVTDSIYFLGQQVNFSKELQQILREEEGIMDNQANLEKYRKNGNKEINSRKLENKFAQQHMKKIVQETIWITYRRNFQKINLQSKSRLYNLYGMISSKCSSDTHWGCMLRCGQNILAETIKRHMIYKLKQEFNNKQLEQLLIKQTNEKQIENEKIEDEKQEVEEENEEEQKQQKLEINNNYFSQEKQKTTQIKQMQAKKLLKTYNNSFFKPNEFQNQQSNVIQLKIDIKKLNREIIQAFADNVVKANENIKIEHLYQQKQQQNQQQQEQLNNGVNNDTIQISQKNSNENENKTPIVDGFVEYSNQYGIYLHEPESHYDKKQQIQKQQHQNKEQQVQLIDNLGANFSIQRICYQSNQQFKMVPGEWYKPNRIMSVLQELHQKNPFQIAQDLAILSLNSDMPISIEELLRKMCDNDNVQYCEINDHQIENKKLNNGHPKIYCPTCHKQKKSLALYLSARIGLSKAEEEYIKQTLQILQCEYSMGIIGGKEDEAYYFLGSVNNEKLIYLDPHTTQQAMTQENRLTEKNIDTFSCKQYKLLNINKLNPTLCFGFYFNTLEDLDMFYNYITQNLDYNNSFISFTNKDLDLQELYVSSYGAKGGEDDIQIIQ